MAQDHFKKDCVYPDTHFVAMRYFSSLIISVYKKAYADSL